MRLPALAACLVLLLAGCADDEPAPEAAEEPTPTPTPSATPTVESMVDTLDIGGGKHLYVECRGSGSPTVFLESGDESGTGQWVQVYQSLQQHTRVCGYDRLGVGGSDDATGCRGLDDLMADKFALLKAAKIEGPFVLVGTSGGGYLTAEHAMRRPETVVGVVIVDTFPAIGSEYPAPPGVLDQIKCDALHNIERRDYAGVENAVWGHRQVVGDVPVVVITNEYGDAAENEDEKHAVEGQRGWFELSPNSRQIIVTTGHNVPGNEPQVIVDAVLQMLG